MGSSRTGKKRPRGTARERTRLTVKCGGLDHTVDYANDTVEFSVPRACVGEPRWVEAAYSGIGTAEEQTEDGVIYHNYRDNALNAGHTYNGWTQRVRRG